MISDGAAEAIKEDDAMSVFFMDFDMAPSVIWARDLYDQMQIRSDFRKFDTSLKLYGLMTTKPNEIAKYREKKDA